MKPVTPRPHTTLLNGGRPTSGETPRNATPLAAREVGRGSPAGQPAPVEVEGDEMRFWGVLRDGVLVARWLSRGPGEGPFRDP